MQWQTKKAGYILRAISDLELIPFSQKFKFRASEKRNHVSFSIAILYLRIRHRPIGYDILFYEHDKSFHPTAL